MYSMLECYSQSNVLFCRTVRALLDIIAADVEQHQQAQRMPAGSLNATYTQYFCFAGREAFTSQAAGTAHTVHNQLSYSAGT